MKTKANYFKLGVFVIVSIMILLAAIITLSSIALNQETILLETYIDESVQGLEVGSPVMQRGVQIGTVKKISFIPREYAHILQPEEIIKYNKYVLVLMEVQSDMFKVLSPDDDIFTSLNACIEHGLRVKLTPQGITGIYYLEADYMDPEKNPVLQLEPGWKPKHFYLPSAPSTLQSFTQSLDSIFTEIEKIDFEAITNAMTGSLVAITQMIRDADIKESRREIMLLVNELRQTTQNVKVIFDRAEGPDPSTVPEILTQLDVTLKRVDQMVSSRQSDIDEILENLKKASENLNQVTEEIKRYPRKLFFGPPPKETELNK